MLDLAEEECPGHGPIQPLVAGAVSVGFCVGPPHACLDARVQQFGWAHAAFRSAMLNAWCSKVSADLCVRKGFSGVAPFWILRDLSTVSWSFGWWSLERVSTAEGSG